MKFSVAIIDIGAVTSVGLNALQTAGSVHAGISRIQEIQDIGWEGKDFNPFRGGFLPTDCLEKLHRKTYQVTPDTLPARLLQLGAPALREVSVSLIEPRIVPSIIVGIADDKQLPDNSSELFLDNLMRQAQVRLDLKESEVVTSGRTAGLLAIHKACLKLSQGYPGPIIAGGIDSYFDLPRLVDLDFDGRILNGSNPDGFLPGEGAGFVLLTSTAAEKNQGQVFGKIVAMTTGFEKGHLYSSEPMLGNGLSETISKLLSEIPDDFLPFQTVYTNLNGENTGAKEWGVSFIRNRNAFAENFELLHPAEYMGETGAAMGPIMIGLAMQGIKRGYHQPSFLIWCTADRGECAALAIHSPYIKL